jgi:hypothetical protein
MKDKFRYTLYPERTYIVEINSEKIEINGKQIVESLSNGQKDKETERETSELSETQS